MPSPNYRISRASLFALQNLRVVPGLPTVIRQSGSRSGRGTGSGSIKLPRGKELKAESKRDICTFSSSPGTTSRVPQHLHHKVNDRYHHHRRPFSATRTMASAQKDWSATQYLKFGNERTRAVHDLISQVCPLMSSSSPRIYDLGCGPGNSTQVLLDAFPGARITGVDSSPDMLCKARAGLPGVEFVQGDLATFGTAGAGAGAGDGAGDGDGGAGAGAGEGEKEGGQGKETSGERVDLLFSNAVFHWLRLDTRIRTLTRLFSALPTGGVVAIQVPDNYNEPSHRLMRETACMADTCWSSFFSCAQIGVLSDAARPDLDPIEGPEMYYDALVPYAQSVNVWRTKYHHVLEGAGAIVEWVKGTGLQPFLHRIEGDEAKRAFLHEYERRLAEAYPKLADGKVLLGYPRLFVVAVRK